MEHGLDDVAVRARSAPAGRRRWNLDVEGVAFRPVQPGRLEPRGKGVDADPGLYPLKKLVPGIHSFALAPCLSCCRHRREKKPCAISTDVKKLWKQVHLCLLQACGFLPAPERSTSPLSPRARPSELSAHVPPL